MSSHHIVREKQEPALLVLGLDTTSEEILGQLLEWSPTVITTPLTAEQINAFGIKVDFVIADAIEEGLQSDVKLIPAEDAGPVHAALTKLIASGYAAVNVITDVIDLTTFESFIDKINLVIFAGSKKTYSINSGFSKWKPAGENICILSTCSNLKTIGLTTPGNNCYTTTNDGFITFEFIEPYIFITEEI
jgi:thiamine pyrophosphokinase